MQIPAVLNIKRVGKVRSPGGNLETWKIYNHMKEEIFI